MHIPKVTKNQSLTGIQNIINQKLLGNNPEKNSQELKTNTNVHNMNQAGLTVLNNPRNDQPQYSAGNGQNSQNHQFSFVPIQNQNAFMPPNNLKFLGNSSSRKPDFMKLPSKGNIKLGHLLLLKNSRN